MAADLFRVVRTLTAADGEQALASGPVDRETAMARFDEMVAWGMDRVRVIREQDYQPALFGPQNQPGVYRGEAARKRAPIHFQPSTLRTALACGEDRDELPFVHMATFRLVDVTCTACLDAVTGSP